MKYRVLEYPSRVKECFSFLTTDYGYSLPQEEAEAFSFVNRYEKGSLRILLIYDIRDNVFDFWIMRGEVGGFPDHADPDTAKTMYDLFKQHEKDLDFSATQPDDSQYLDALRLNAKLLRAYGGEVLRGNGWF